MPALELTDIVSILAMQAVNTQQIFDLAYKEELDRFAFLAEGTGPAQRDILQPLAPRRMLMREFQLSSSLSFAIERDTELRVKALPFNMNYSLRHSLKYDSGSRLAMCVEQVPIVEHVQQEQKGEDRGQSK